MSLESRSQKHDLLYDQAIKNTATHWASELVRELRAVLNEPGHPEPTPLLDLPLMKIRYSESSHRLLLFDYDVFHHFVVCDISRVP